MKKKNYFFRSPLVRSICSSILLAAFTVFQVIPIQALTFNSGYSADPSIALFQDILSPTTVFSNSTSITLTDHPAAGPPQAASLYPSNITVSGMTGTISSLTVTLNNVTMPRPRDNDFMLVGPGGQAFILASDCGGLTGWTAINITLSDAAATTLPTTDTGLATGTYRPTDVSSIVAGNDTYPAPAPASANSPAPTGAATFASVFGGLNPNGTWSLYAIDDALGGGAGSIAGGWSIDITTAGAAASTTTTINSSLNPSLTTQAVTFTATVTSAGNPVTVSSAIFKDGATIIGGPISLDGSGQAQFTANAGTLSEGNHTITATYVGTPAFAASSGSVIQTVDSPTVVTGPQFCNNGGFTIPDNAVSGVYPSHINVTGLIGTVAKVTVNLKTVSLNRAQDADMLLVGPTAQNLLILSDVGDAGSTSGINLTLDDAAASLMPTGSPLAGGTFRPSDYGVASSDVFPAPAPASINHSAPGGASTLAGFNTTIPNGIWSLYTLDDSIGGTSSTVGGWCVNFTLTPFSTTTTLAASPNPVTAGNNVTFTATVTSPTGTPTGTVEFFDGATSLGTGGVSFAGDNGQTLASGTATLTTNALAPGNHNITAHYNGVVTTGGGGFTASTSSVLVEGVFVLTAAGATVSGRVVTSAGRGISKAVVTLTDPDGATHYALTNPFGYYRFVDVESGLAYVFRVSAKNHTFAQPVVIRTINDDVTGLDFIADP